MKPTPGARGAQNALTAGLYVTSTPIGNARDITLRALDVLRDCDAILAEDTRRTAKLLAIHGIKRQLIAYNDHNAPRARPQIIERLKRGERLALVSDAGTPLISDPGYKLVREALSAGVSIHAVPGASAVLTALALSGLPPDRFFFVGFLPSASGPRQALLQEVKGVQSTLIFFESPQRVSESLSDMHQILGSRQAVLARELTKLHEEVLRAALAELAERYSSAAKPRGEITIIVAPPEQAEPETTKIDSLLRKALTFMPVRASADLVAEALSLPRREAYARALALKEQSGDAG